MASRLYYFPNMQIKHTLNHIPRGCSHVLSLSARSFSDKNGRNLPTNDTNKAITTRDEKFFAQVKALKDVIEQEPPVLLKGFLPTAITNNGVFMGSTFFEHPPNSLPQLFATALLDPRAFCKQSASSTTTISGGDAARCLLRGKQNFRETLRKELTLARSLDVQAMYVLRGHGVPSQLFQHILDVAQGWLNKEDNAHELSVQNVFGALVYDR
jgi:hypothetical protein